MSKRLLEFIINILVHGKILIKFYKYKLEENSIAKITSIISMYYINNNKIKQY